MCHMIWVLQCLSIYLGAAASIEYAINQSMLSMSCSTTTVVVLLAAGRCRVSSCHLTVMTGWLTAVARRCGTSSTSTAESLCQVSLPACTWMCAQPWTQLRLPGTGSRCSLTGSSVEGGGRNDMQLMFTWAPRTGLQRMGSRGEQPHVCEVELVPTFATILSSTAVAVAFKVACCATAAIWSSNSQHTT